MLREILTSRVLQIGFVLCAVIISSLQLYSWHVRRTTETELEKTIQTLRRVKENYKTRSSEGVNGSVTHNITGTNVTIKHKSTFFSRRCYRSLCILRFTTAIEI